MPSRDDRNPSFCSERMKICQKHLSKVYSRSKNLLVAARAGKVLPEVTGSAARGFTEGGNNPGDGNGLSKFEKKKLTPYLNAVAGLFDGPSLLKQFQLKKLRISVAGRNFKSYSQPDCPQSCNESKSREPAPVPLFIKDNPLPASAFTSGIRSDSNSTTATSAIGQNSTGTAINWTNRDDCADSTLSTDVRRYESFEEGWGHRDLHQNSDASTLSVTLDERVPVRQLDNDQQLQAGKGSSSSSFSNNYRIDDKGQWNIPPYLTNVSSEPRVLSKFVVPQSSFPSYQQQSAQSGTYRIDDTCTGNQPQFLPSTELKQQRALSTISRSQRLSSTESQQKAVSIMKDRKPSQVMASIDSTSGWDPTQILADADSSQITIPNLSGRHPSKLLTGNNDSQHRAVSFTTDRNRSENLSDFQKRAVSTLDGRTPSQLLSHTDSLQQRAVSIESRRNPSQLFSGTMNSQQRAVSTTGDWTSPEWAPRTDSQQESVSTTNSKGNEILGTESQQRPVLTTSRTFSKMLPRNDSEQKAVSSPMESQPGTFASRLNKKVSKSGNVLQSSVAKVFGTPGGPPKPFHTLTVSQLHDAICDHSSPDCPSFKGKEMFGSSPQIRSPEFLRPRQSLEEHDPPHADALGTAGSANPQSTDDLDPSRQDGMSSNEKCAQYAFDVRTDMKRQEKSSANLWKYGSMAVCTENPGRDYTTGESPPDAWELMAKNKFEITGIHWSKSGSRKVVNHVCQILKQNKWGKGVIELLDNVKGFVNAHCVNAILQQQKDPQLCLAFFNWAKIQKGYKHDVFAFTTMINILGRARNLRGVRHLLEDMHTGGVEPTVATYNTLILCYGRVESLNESLRVFRIMQEAGCKPDNVTYSILIHLCIKAGYLQEALKLYQGMREAGVQPDTITYSIVIDSLGKSGNLREARKLFREMRERGFVPNEFTYNSMIDRHAKARKTQHASKYYTEMRDAGFKLNAVTCTTMMGVMGSLGKFDQAESLFSEMQQAGIVADTAAYSLMINMWGNSGNLDKAVSWYGRMLGNLVTPSLSVFSSLVNAHLEANLYQAAQHFLTSMGMWGINSDLKLYTILLHHCTVCEKQEHADAVLGIMDRLGHPAHRFLYELLTAKNQDKETVKLRVVSFFDSLEQEEQVNKQGFANALIEFLHKLQCKTDPGFVWEIAMEKGLFPSAIIRREAPNHWLADLHSMSVGTALVALPRLLAILRSNWIQNPTKRVYIVTGWGKRSRITGTSALKQAVSDVLEATRSPFSLDNANAGVFVSYGPPFCDWISQPSIMKKLGVMASEGVVK